jgi:hypothetical protein
MGSLVECPYLITKERGMPAAVCYDNGLSINVVMGIFYRNERCNYKGQTTLRCEVDEKIVGVLAYEEITDGDTTFTIPIRYIKR